MEKGSTGSKQTKRYSWIIGLLIFITALLLGCIIVKNIEKEKKTAAAYTAQSTVKRINAQLDQYVELSEFLENVILAGPYQLKQGETGALLFHPVYQNNITGNDTFWGFVIIVIDWDKFIDEIVMERLSEA